MEFVMKATFALTALNVALLALLTWIYGRNFAKMRSGISVGLLLFTLAFLAQYLTSLYFYITGMDYFVDMVSTHVFVLTLLQSVAFGALTAISWR